MGFDILVTMEYECTHALLIVVFSNDLE